MNTTVRFMFALVGVFTLIFIPVSIVVWLTLPRLTDFHASSCDDGGLTCSVIGELLHQWWLPLTIVTLLFAFFLIAHWIDSRGQ